MSTRSYVGIPDPDQPGQIQLRHVHSDGVPRYMVPTLRGIWAGTAAGDSHRLAALLLEHDWDYLDPKMTDGSNSTPFAGEELIPGVGMTLAATDGDGHVLPPEPVTVVALNDMGDLDAQWIYLIDPGTDTLSVHIGGGDVVSREPLAS